MASHNRGVVVGPKEIDRGVSAQDMDVILQYAARHLPGLTRNAVYEKVCIYTNTPDEGFIIDALPGTDRCYIISACSGHGFKFAPLIGEIASELAVNGNSRHPLGRFRLERLEN